MGEVTIVANEFSNQTTKKLQEEVSALPSCSAIIHHLTKKGFIVRMNSANGKMIMNCTSRIRMC